MSTITFFAGLSWQRHEIAARGYRRVPVTLVFDLKTGVYANPMRVDFGLVPESWGLIDGMTLSTSGDGEVLAVSPLLIPIFIKAGGTMSFDPGVITMNQKSIDAIVNRRPILLRA